MQNAPRRGALAATLTGGLLLLYAWALAAVTTSSESATSCPSVLGRELVTRSGDDAFCAPLVDERIRLVLIVGAVGLALLIVGLLWGRSALFAGAPVGASVSRVSQVALGVLGLLTIWFAAPLGFLAYLLTDPSGGGRELAELFRSALPIGMAAGALITAALASTIGRRGNRLTLDHAMTALSLAMPLVALILIDLDGLGVTNRGAIDPDWTSESLRYAACGLPVAVALVVFAWRQNRGIAAPHAGLSGLAILVSAAALLIAMTPEAFKGGYGFGSDQGADRFAIWVAVAVLLPWLVTLVPVSTPATTSPQTSLA